MGRSIVGRNWRRDDVLRTRFNALAASLTKTDRILTGRREVSVKMRHSSETGVSAPGFSDGRTVTIHRDLFENIGDPITLVQIVGLNYHELSHIELTPRNTTRFKKAVQAETMGIAFNALEDQRIETQFVALYGNAAKYFTEMVIQFFVKNDKTWALAHMLTHGRRFLPLEIREQFRARFALAGTKDAKRVEEIIDEYRLLDLSLVDSNSSLTTQALSLIREYDKIMKRAQNASGDEMPNPMGADEEGERGCGSSNESNPDRSTSRQAKAKAEEDTEEQDEVEENGEDGSGFWDDVPGEEGDEDEDEDDGRGSASDEEEDSDDEDGESGGDGDDESDEDDSGRGSDSGNEDDEYDEDDEDYDDDSSGSEGGEPGSSDGDDDSDDDSEESGEEGADGIGDGGHEPLTDNEMEDLLDDILNGVLESDQIQGDLRQMNNVINDPDAFDLDDEVVPSTFEAAEPRFIQAANAIEKELRRLYAEVEPGWKYGSDTGRLNVTRAMASDDFEDVFDEWDEGREHDAGIEAVLVVDTSGSMMGDEIRSACVALWILKRALDAVGATVSVMGFDETTTTLFRRHDKVNRSQVSMFPALGGDTCPAQSFRNARRILTQTDKPNKLFAILTDGGWSTNNPENGDTREDLETLIKSIPATTLFFGTGGIRSHLLSESFDFAQFVDHSDQMLPLVKNIVTHMLRNAARKVR